ncbi:hypothetical protein HGRIS_007926 [Hohenbuehelia grisea]|uniref:Uncharacterized protein n=1 Tax=Hohenbuehelia grisea TaxID=104357 RepID=A0ABR3J6B9_9AGAR
MEANASTNNIFNWDLDELQRSEAFIRAYWNVSQMRLPSYRFSHIARHHPYPRGGPRRHFDPFWDDFEAQFDPPRPPQEPVPDFFAPAPRYRQTTGDDGEVEGSDEKRGYILVVVQDFAVPSDRRTRAGRKF